MYSQLLNILASNNSKCLRFAFMFNTPVTYKYNGTKHKSQRGHATIEVMEVQKKLFPN